MPYPILQVDAFTDQPFRGNPAAVCLLDEPAPEGWMQDVAAEMNLSETAFLHPAGATGRYHLRWFTPRIEVELCGHATLAAAHALWESGHCDCERAIEFETKSGVLTAERRGAWIELEFPTLVTEPATPPEGLISALAGSDVLVPLHTGRTRFDYLVEIGDEAIVRSLAPDMGALRVLPVRGVIVTARAGDVTRASGVDFVSRFFAPAAGVDEDPVTGSAHCALGDYWASKLGREELVGFQASERGGLVRVRVAGSRTFLGGQAVTVWRGVLADGCGPA